MKITSDQVAHVAKLARLAVTPDEVHLFAEQLSSILTYVEKLNQLDTSHIEPTSHVLPLSNVFREDKVRNSLPTEKVFETAPEREGPFFRVPKIIE